MRSLPVGLTLATGLGRRFGERAFVERARASPGEEPSDRSSNGSFRQIATFLDPVETPSMRELSDNHRWTADENRLSFRNMKRRHMSPQRVDQRFMFLNTFLMDVDADNIVGDISGGTKPYVEYRSTEIGLELRDREIDVAALAEVWTDDEMWPLLAAVSGKTVSESKDEWRSDSTKPHQINHIKDHIMSEGGIETLEAIGGEGPAEGSAGLLTFSTDHEFVTETFEEYQFEAGSKERKADKGVLMGVIDVGLGPSQLRIYNTHLQAGGHARTRLRQVVQLAAFIHRTKPEQDPALVPGDFNITAPLPSTEEAGGQDDGKSTIPSTEYGAGVQQGDVSALDGSHLSQYSTRELAAAVEDELNIPERVLEALTHTGGDPNAPVKPEKTEYEILTDLLGALGFRDLWVERNGSRGFTKNVHKNDSEAKIGEKICKEATDEKGLCEDTYSTSDLEESDRVDYIFVSEPSPEQSFRMDFTRPRRPRTTRDPRVEGFDDLAWLSDHLGVMTTLRLVPA